MREGLNYMYLLSDGAKQAECQALAALLVGVTLIPGLVEAVAQVLLLGWAFAESVLDVRLLLNGKSVAFWKGADTWKLSLAQALDLGNSLAAYDGREDRPGLRYRDYLGMLYGVKKKDRIFTVTKSYLHHEMDRGAKEAGVKRIRIHDLRHSHISLLIDMGFSAVAIADRVGHESIEITYRYAHLFPSKQTEMADKLDFERTGA